MNDMASTQLSDRICRVFAAACVGDALGAATEGMHPDEIKRVFGGCVTSLQPPPPRAPFALGLPPGRLTDDATQMLVMARKVMATKGQPTTADIVTALIDWAADEEVFRRFAGPTTRLAVEQLRAGVSPENVASPAAYSCVFGTSNGGAMRAPAAGCARPGDIEGAARLACRLAAPTHNTQIAYGGAAAVAAAIAAGLGLGGDGLLIDAADAGAAIGEAEAVSHGRIVGGAGVRRRIELAARIGERWRGDAAGASAELTQIVGNGVAMAEAVPHALGLVVAADANPWDAIVAAVNGGNDSDTIALIAGSIAAAWWRGADALPAGIVSQVEDANGLCFANFSVEFANALFEDAP
jgi:ADP-ribosylglycohydrolase